MKYIIIFSILSLFTISLNGQNLDNYRDIISFPDEFKILDSNIDEIKLADIKNFWLDNSIQKRRFGFIGLDYCRLHIRFTSITKDTNIPNQYLVIGKSKVFNNVCEFHGIIDIKESYYTKSTDISENIVSGLIIGDYIFYEYNENNNSGVFKGKFVTYWMKDDNGDFTYMELPDNIGNNQFIGNWISYNKSNKKFIANWGNNRILGSGDLDIGTSEFGVNIKYKEKGWDTFLKATGGIYCDKNIREQAQKEEMREWWKD
jgi:hypothetical protein